MGDFNIKSFQDLEDGFEDPDIYIEDIEYTSFTYRHPPGMKVSNSLLLFKKGLEYT